MDAPLAVFVGRQFAAALSEGLRRSRGTGRPDIPAPVVPTPGSPTTREGDLLGDHAGEILARFGARLQGAPGVTAPARGRITDWARQVLGARAPTGPVRVAATAPWKALAGSLLIETAVDVLPAGSPDVPEAIGALARAVRLTGTGEPLSDGRGLPDRRKQGFQ
ncbi:hypothetical protein [Streptomyces sp. SID12488]|uniref:hypothetical protein n=1 Tax=Streptomyces sp. SID12488 TaxID=2706040 RepID=UPI0013DC6913|nr:hypothetical protein [Streptomyces sp. SID12488]NEA65789.1 hypothetical protein [Streptomyces sp. SID12488]